MVQAFPISISRSDVEMRRHGVTLKYI